MFVDVHFLSLQDCKITLNVADAIEFAGLKEAEGEANGGHDDTKKSEESEENTDDKERRATNEIFGQLPHLDDNVTCVGFPMGGDQISVTRGVVSRIQVSSNGILQIQVRLVSFCLVLLVSLWLLPSSIGVWRLSNLATPRH